MSPPPSSDGGERASEELDALFCERCRTNSSSLNRVVGDNCSWCLAEDGVESPLVANPLRLPTRASAYASPTPLRQTVSIRRHTLVVDEPPRLGGGDEGPDPFELLAAAVATCTSITVGIYGRHRGWPVDDLRVDCQISTDPFAGKQLEVTLHFGEGLDRARRERLAEVAAKCPLRRFLSSPPAFVDLIDE